MERGEAGFAGLRPNAPALRRCSSALIRAAGPKGGETLAQRSGHAVEDEESLEPENLPRGRGS